MEGKRDFGSHIVSCSMVMYEDGRGGRGGSSSCGNSGSDFEDDCESWSQDGLSITGVDGSSSSDSADEGCGNVDKSSTTRSGGDESVSDDGESGQKGEWLLSLRAVIDQMVSSKRKGRGKKRVVETNIRPPTTSKYFIGMSGFPSKVPSKRKPT
ncbi:hypothetical protein ACI65C_001221 [Semiaphis heraclei]